MLRAAIASALAGRSEFELVEAGQVVPPPADIPSIPFPPHAVVVWRLENRAEAVWHLLAAIDAGVVPILVAATTPRGKLEKLRERFSTFGVFDGRDAHVAAEPTIDPELFLGFVTSGSTGDPKLLVTSEERLAAGVRAIHAAQALEDVTSTGALLPVGYSYAFVNQLLWSVAFQRRLLLTPGLLMPADTLTMLRTHDVQMLCLVANQLHTLVARGFDAEYAVPSTRVVNFAGAPFPVADFAGLKALFPNARALNNYGCTEAMPRISVATVESGDHDVTDVGHPLESLRVRIAEPEGRIEFAGTSGALGVLRPDGALDRASEWTPSGDVGRIEAGRLHVLGRADQVANVGGERISLVEVENTLVDAGFRHAAVWIDDGTVVAVVHGDIAQRTYQRMLRDRLPRAAWPTQVVPIDEWPLAPNGKTDRKRLKALARERR